MTSFILAAMAFASITFAQLATYSPQGENGVSYSVNVPDASASSGKGDIFFQITAPSSLQWVGLGQGGAMTGANIFIIYSDASGTNVTLSPRLGKGNFEPDYDSEAQVTLIDGTGIANGKMTANVRCANCVSWTGESMSLTDAKSNWIWAVKEGSPIGSNSQTQDLQQHTNMDSFSFDLTKARGGSTLNPFQASSPASPSSSSSASPPSSTGASGGSGAGAGEGSSGGGSEGGGKSATDKQDLAHGILMAVAFLILFPFGALSVRLFSFPGLVWVHAGIQVFAYILAIAGLGIGVVLATRKSHYQLTQAHPIIGMLVVALLFFQPILGLIHHQLYKKHHARTFWITGHIWFGRAVVVLGAINGGLGLQLADNSMKDEIAYGVVAGVVYVAWFAVVVVGAFRSKASEGETGGKLMGTNRGNGHEKRGSPGESFQ